jgi:hypothetical protein
MDTLQQQTQELFQNYNNISNETATNFVNYVFSLVPGTGGIIHGNLEITGNLKVDTNFVLDGHVNDTSNFFSADFNFRQLGDSTGGLVLDWQNGLLDSPTGTTINWKTSQLFDASTGLHALNWVLKQLFDGSGVESLDWSNRQLKRNDGSVSVDWEGLALQNLSGQGTVLWNNEQLVDAAGNVTVGWGSQNLIDVATKVALNWTARTLYAIDGITPQIEWCDNSNNILMPNLPTAVLGLPTGALWNNAGVLSIAP